MPPAKKLKSGSASKSKPNPARPAASQADGETEFAQLAKQHWLKTTKRAAKVKVKNDVLKSEIWDALEKDAFPSQSLLALESLQILERYVCGTSEHRPPTTNSQLLATFGRATPRRRRTITFS